MQPSTPTGEGRGHEDILPMQNTADLAEKQRRQAKKVDYRELEDKDDEFEAMLVKEEDQYQSTKRRKVQTEMIQVITNTASMQSHRPHEK